MAIDPILAGTYVLARPFLKSILRELIESEAVREGIADAAGFADGLAGNVLQRLFNGEFKGRDLLRNHDLTLAVGDTLARLLREAAKQQPSGLPDADRLKKLAANARDGWKALATMVQQVTRPDGKTVSIIRLREDKLAVEVIQKAWETGGDTPQPVPPETFAHILRKFELATKTHLTEPERAATAAWLSDNYARAFKEILLGDDRARRSLQLSLFSHLMQRTASIEAKIDGLAKFSQEQKSALMEKVGKASEEQVNALIAAMNLRDVEWQHDLIAELTREGGPLQAMRAEIASIGKAIALSDETRDGPALHLPPVRIPAAGDPNELLRYNTSNVPLQDREDALALLDDFVRSPRPFEALAITGPGGVGKSRLALEWARALQAEGWRAGFLSSKDETWPRTAARYSGWQPTRPTAIVIDYAVRFSEDIPAFLTALTDSAERFASTPVRILFLDREGEDLPWLRHFPGPESDTTAGWRKCFFAAPHVLAPMAGAAPQDALLEAAHKFCGKVFQPPADRAAFDSQLDKATAGGRPLLLLLYGLAMADDPQAHIRSVEALLDWDLRREFRHWRDIATKHGKAKEEATLRQLAAAIAVITFANGLPFGKARDLVKGDEELLRDLKLILGTKGDDALHPLRPDLRAIRYLLSGGAVRHADPDLRDKKTPELFNPPEALRQALLLDAEGVTNMLYLAVDDDRTPDRVTRLIGKAGAARRDGESRSDTAAFVTMGDRFITLPWVQDAAASFRAASLIAERLVASDPENAEWQRDLSVSYDRIGNTEVAQGRTAEALAAYRKSLDIREQLAASDPKNAEWQRDLSISYEEIGNTEAAQGRTAEALAAYRKSLDIAERLAVSEPKNAQWQRDLSVSYIKIGDTEAAQGRTAEALAAYRKSLDIAERLAVSEPKNAQWQRDLSVSYIKIGDTEAAQGRTAGALVAYHKSLEIRERLAASDPSNAGWQRDLSVSYGMIGIMEEAQGHSAEALVAYLRTLDIFERLAASDPKNAGWQRDLSVSYNKIGDTEAAHGRAAEALPAYRKSLDIREQLAASDPKNAKWQYDLGISHERIGSMQSALGQTSEALESFRKKLNIISALAASDPNNAEWQRDLSVSFERIGGTEAAEGRTAEALSAYQKSLDIAEQLAASDPKNAGWQRDLSVSYNGGGRRLGLGGEGQS